ncbi:LysR substrate-binding domain-containing protein, partial [Acinetobacter baumannii]
NIKFNIVQTAHNILFNINSIGMGLGCGILPSYIEPLTLNNIVTRPLDVDLPFLDLYVSYRKDAESSGVKEFIDLLSKVFYLNINKA